MSSATCRNGSAKTVSMHWFRKALRLHDNPALIAALEVAKGARDSNGSAVFPVYVLDGDCYHMKRCSALRANFLVECLNDLDAGLRSLGSRLYVVSGDPVEELPRLWKEFGVSHLTYEADETGEPYALARDRRVQKLAREAGVDVRTEASETMFELDAYVSRAGGSAEDTPATMGGFQALFKRMGGVPKPLAVPSSQHFPSGQSHSKYHGKMLPPRKATELPWPRTCPRDQVTPIWDAKDCVKLTPIAKGGESVALARLDKAVSSRPEFVASYEKPKTSCTSLKPSTTALSPYLSFGCLSPRTAWHAIADAIARAPASCRKTAPPVSLHGQLLWRDFNNLIAHAANCRNPGSWGRMEGNPYCRQIPWSHNNDLLDAWKEGRTGFPWIDACMMQLKSEGWIHHLGRHAVACFLTRGDLWQSWEDGQQHFEGQLLDADYALNGFNWLWLSCSGFFYQYFRCYSPISFQQKNDPHGNYIRKWVPSLGKLPDKYIYEPWKAPPALLKQSGIKLGVDYPHPVVDHSVASKANMSKMAAAYKKHKEAAEPTGVQGKVKKEKETKSLKRNVVVKAEPARKKLKRE